MFNQNPEQIARDRIDSQLCASGWIIQSLQQVYLNAGVGVAVKEYLTDVGPADYMLFVDGKPCGIIEAKREEEGVRLNILGQEFTNLPALQFDKSYIGYSITKPISEFMTMDEDNLITMKSFIEKHLNSILDIRKRNPSLFVSRV